MGKTRESNLWLWLARAREFFGPRLFIERIENSVGSGTPDVRVTLDGVEFFIELKTVHQPARASTPIKTTLRKEQIDWSEDYLAAKGRGLFMLIQVGRRRYLIPGQEFVNLWVCPVPEDGLRELALDTPTATAVQVLNTARIHAKG